MWSGRGACGDGAPPGPPRPTWYALLLTFCARLPRMSRPPKQIATSAGRRHGQRQRCRARAGAGARPHWPPTQHSSARARTCPMPAPCAPCRCTWGGVNEAVAQQTESSRFWRASLRGSASGSCDPVMTCRGRYGTLLARQSSATTLQFLIGAAPPPLHALPQTPAATPHDRLPAVWGAGVARRREGGAQGCRSMAALQEPGLTAGLQSSGASRGPAQSAPRARLNPASMRESAEAV